IRHAKNGENYRKNPKNGEKRRSSGGLRARAGTAAQRWKPPEFPPGKCSEIRRDPAPKRGFSVGARRFHCGASGCSRAAPIDLGRRCGRGPEGALLRPHAVALDGDTAFGILVETLRIELMSSSRELWDGAVRRLGAELSHHALEAWIRPLVAEA